jgi:hypothetical protein
MTTVTPSDQAPSASIEIGPAVDLPAAAEILSNTAESFGWAVLRERHPTLISQIRDAIPYEPKQRAQLDRLLHEIRSGTIEPLPTRAARAPQWRAWAAEWIGRRWKDIGFLSAESYFYAKLLDAVDYWETGNWRGVDPFEFLKSRELTSAELGDDLRALNSAATIPTEARTRALILASLWGNQADLGFRIGATTGGNPATMSHLVADDTERLIRALASDRTDRVCVIGDNAGRELAGDLILIDHLLHSGWVTAVDLHLKPHPYYVSDATTGDLVAMLRRLAAGPSAAAAVAARLTDALGTGRLSISTHWFYGAPFTFHRMPDDLRHRIRKADLTILKGDLNYRRLVGDYWWPKTAAFDALTHYFPTPLAALRTLKSNVVVGLDAATIDTLDASGPSWRTDGTYGLVQVRGTSPTTA